MSLPKSSLAKQCVYWNCFWRSTGDTEVAVSPEIPQGVMAMPELDWEARLHLPSSRGDTGPSMCISFQMVSCLKVHGANVSLYGDFQKQPEHNMAVNGRQPY